MALKERKDKSCGGASVRSRQVLCFKIEDLCLFVSTIREGKFENMSKRGL